MSLVYGKFAHFFLLIATISFSSITIAKEGHGGGNGGGIQYCGTPLNGQLQFEFYDLKEIRDHLIKERQRTRFFSNPTWSKEDYFNKAVEKVAQTSPRLANQLRLAYEFYNAPGRIQNSGKHILERTKDFSLFSIDQNCEYKQLVNWIEPEESEAMFGKKELIILRDNDLYEKLDARGQAVSDFHEVSYAIARGFNLITEQSGSNFVRMFSGQVFSEGNVDGDLFPKISLFDVSRLPYGSKNIEIFVPDRKCNEVGIISFHNLSKYRINVWDHIYSEWGLVRSLDGNETWNLKQDSIIEMRYEIAESNWNSKQRKAQINVTAEVCGNVMNKTFEIDESKANQASLTMGFAIKRPPF